MKTNSNILWFDLPATAKAFGKIASALGMTPAMFFSGSELDASKLEHLTTLYSAAPHGKRRFTG